MRISFAGGLRQLRLVRVVCQHAARTERSEVANVALPDRATADDKKCLCHQILRGAPLTRSQLKGVPRAMSLAAERPITSVMNSGGSP
jgi:hypothetical protein